MIRFEAHIEIPTPSPMESIYRLRNIIAECKKHGYHEQYCIYCGKSIDPGRWQFICFKCHTPAIRGEYTIPALWIGELFIKISRKERFNVRTFTASEKDC